MHANCRSFRAILSLLLLVAGKANCDDISEISSAENIESEKKNSRVEPNYFWMSAMGDIAENLMNVQAIVVKDENVKASCGKADRKSIKRYLMCAGSILSRNHVLTSATCIHLATHIKHNVRGPLAVAIAPLNPSMQVIKVLDYKINSAHDSNPYSRNYLRNNIAILKLACRIDMDNLRKIDLPEAPFVSSCEEDNCVVAIYRRMKRTHWVMYQTLAPHVPLRNRRRKETMTKDETSEYERSEATEDAAKIGRVKRKLAERPVFTNRDSKKYDSSRKLAANSTSEDSSIERTTSRFEETKNVDVVTMISLEDVVHEDWAGPTFDESARSFVVRSSDGHRGCAQTGAPVMLNTTQLAIASAPCDDRQSWKKWGYTDLYDNLDWIRETLQDWYGNGSDSSMLAGMGPGSQTTTGNQPNGTSCSTCIFNFFIQVGCEKNEKCKGKYPSPDAQGSQQPSNGDSWDRPKGCSTSVGIEIGRGCRRRNKTAEAAPNSRAIWGRPSNLKAPNSHRGKNSPRAVSEDSPGLEKPLKVEAIKTIVVDEERDDEGKKGSGNSESRSDGAKSAMSVEGKNNEGGGRDFPPRNTEGDSRRDGPNSDEKVGQLGPEDNPKMDDSSPKLALN